MVWQRGLVSAEPRPLETELTAPPGDDPLESSPAEHSTEPMTEPLVANPEVAAGPRLSRPEPVWREVGVEIGDTEPPVETVEEWLAEEAGPAAVDTLDQSRSMERA